MNRIRIFVAALSLGALMAFSVVGGGADAATCQYQAQIDAQSAAIVQIAAERDQAIAGLPASLAARVRITYDAQIAERQKAIAEFQAACAS